MHKVSHAIRNLRADFTNLLSDEREKMRGLIAKGGESDTVLEWPRKGKGNVA